MSAVAVDVTSLAADFSGHLVLPDDPRYDERRGLFNAMFDLRPALIARCAGVADVAAAIRFARERELPLAVRGGGHAIDGKGSCDDGVVVDLGPMDGVMVDPRRKRARVQAGARWAIVDREAQYHGLATTGGTVSDTGVAGLTLGGGVGWAMRRLGATVDNLVSIDAITVDGEPVHADREENPDLFWGMRGGGGNFAIATAFEFDLHRFGPQVTAGILLYSEDQMAEAVRLFASFMDSASRDLMGICAVWRIPPVAVYPAELRGRLMTQIALVHSGSLAAAEAELAPLRAALPITADLVGPMTYVGAQRMIEVTMPLAMEPPGLRTYEKGGYLAAIGEPVVESLIASAREAPPSVVEPGHMALASLWRMGGALDDVEEDAMAFSRDGAAYFWDAVANWRGPEEDAPFIAWTRALARRLDPLSLGRTYVNLTVDDERDRLREAYGAAKYARLVEIKDRWDPGNVLRINKNVPPSAMAA